MANNVKMCNKGSEINCVRYSAYDNPLINNSTIYMGKRKSFIQSEVIHLEFMHVQENDKNECVKPLRHIEM